MTETVDRPKFGLDLPEPQICGFACFRKPWHRGLHQWEAVRLEMTKGEWRRHLEETERAASCLLDAGEWSDVRTPCD